MQPELRSSKHRPYPWGILLIATIILAGFWMIGSGNLSSYMALVRGFFVDNASSPERAAGDDRPNLLVITLCSVRIDHLAYLGYNKQPTPYLDALAAQSAVFENAWTNGTFTLAAHASLLTGQLPGPAGIVDSGAAIHTELPVIPEILSLYGYQTLASAPNSERVDVQVTGDQAAPAPGRRCESATGVEGAHVRESTMHTTFGPVAGQERGFKHFFVGEHRACGDSVVSSLKESAGPFFALVHIKNAHSPYGLDLTPPDKRDPRLAQWLSLQSSHSREEQWAADARLMEEMQADPSLRESFDALYDQALGRMDAELGELLDRLKRANLLQNTVVVVMGDHGESLGEAEELGHAGILRPEVLRVPLLIYHPEHPEYRGRYFEAVSTVDVSATLLMLGEATPPAGVHGQSLLPLFRGEALSNRVVIAQANARDLPEPDASAHGRYPLSEAIVGGGQLLRYVPGGGLSKLWRFSGVHMEVVSPEEPESILKLLEGRAGILGDWRLMSQSDAPKLTEAQIEQMHRAGYW